MKPHGTRARYQKGCRCERCREANRLAMKRWRSEHPETSSRSLWLPVNGCLNTVCWCGKTVKPVRVEHVRAGKTYSCGGPACMPPAS